MLKTENLWKRIHSAVQLEYTF